jgi:hypothetical protein
MVILPSGDAVFISWCLETVAHSMYEKRPLRLVFEPFGRPGGRIGGNFDNE